VSGSPVVPSDAKRYGLTLPMVPELHIAGSATSMNGYMYYCCWPCACDTMDYIHLDTATVQTADGARSYLVTVIGDPCTDGPSQLEAEYTDAQGQRNLLATQAPEVTCEGNKLRGATVSDNGYPILSLFFTAEGTSSTGNSTAVIGVVDSANDVNDMMANQCKQRSESGFQSGMSMIFRQIASITPISTTTSTAVKHSAHTINTNAAAVQESTSDNTPDLDARVTTGIVLGCLGVVALAGVAVIAWRTSSARREAAPQFVNLESDSPGGNEQVSVVTPESDDRSYESADV